MLIRWATNEDKSAWMELSKEYDKYICELTSNMSEWYNGFENYMESKIKKSEAVIAIDKMTSKCYGIIAFSRNHNRITFFGVSERACYETTAERLLLVALRQLNINKDISTQIPISNRQKFLQQKQFLENNGFKIFSDDLMEQGVKVYKLVREATNEKRGNSFHYNYTN